MPEPKIKQQMVRYPTWERMRRFLAMQAAAGKQPESQVDLVSRALERELNRLGAPRIEGAEAA